MKGSLTRSFPCPLHRVVLHLQPLDKGNDVGRPAHGKDARARHYQDQAERYVFASSGLTDARRPDLTVIPNGRRRQNCRTDGTRPSMTTLASTTSSTLDAGPPSCCCRPARPRVATHPRRSYRPSSSPSHHQSSSPSRRHPSSPLIPVGVFLFRAVQPYHPHDVPGPSVGRAHHVPGLAAAGLPARPAAASRGNSARARFGRQPTSHAACADTEPFERLAPSPFIPPSFFPFFFVPRTSKNGWTTTMRLRRRVRASPSSRPAACSLRRSSPGCRTRRWTPTPTPTVRHRGLHLYRNPGHVPSPRLAVLTPLIPTAEHCVCGSRFFPPFFCRRLDQRR